MEGSASYFGEVSGCRTRTPWPHLWGTAGGTWAGRPRTRQTLSRAVVVNMLPNRLVGMSAYVHKFTIPSRLRGFPRVSITTIGDPRWNLRPTPLCEEHGVCYVPRKRHASRGNFLQFFPTRALLRRRDYFCPALRLGFHITAPSWERRGDDGCRLSFLARIATGGRVDVGSHTIGGRPWRDLDESQFCW